jgi:hypothetical protein
MTGFLSTPKNIPATHNHRHISHFPNKNSWHTSYGQSDTIELVADKKMPSEPSLGISRFHTHPLSLLEEILCSART